MKLKYRKKVDVIPLLFQNVIIKTNVTFCFYGQMLFEVFDGLEFNHTVPIMLAFQFNVK